MNRRERRAMERMSQKEFQKIKKETLAQLIKQHPDMNFTKEEMAKDDELVKQIIKNELEFK
jgi:hypothetical protein